MKASATDADKAPIPSRQDELEFREEYRECKTTKKRLAESLCKAFSIALGQTTEAMKAKIEDSIDWTNVNNDSNCIGLLKIIKKIAHNTEDQKNPTLSLIEATQSINTLRQQDNQSPEAFKLQFENMMDAITSSKGCIYQPPMLETVSQTSHTAPQVDLRILADELARATLIYPQPQPQEVPSTEEQALQRPCPRPN
jgi:hypothetical protein